MWNRKSSEGNPGNSSDSNSITEGFHFYYFKVILSLKTSEVLCVCPVRLRLSFQFSAGYSSSHRFTLIHFAPPGNGSHGRQQAHIYSPALEPPPACCCTISSFTCNQKKSNVSVCARVRVCVCSCEKKLQEPTRHRCGQSQILPLPPSSSSKYSSSLLSSSSFSLSVSPSVIRRLYYESISRKSTVEERWAVCVGVGGRSFHTLCWKREVQNASIHEHMMNP